MFVCSAVLTSCSSMAVGLEAELSATTRSQVEVTKILPDWLEEKRKTTNQRTGGKMHDIATRGKEMDESYDPWMTCSRLFWIWLLML